MFSSSTHLFILIVLVTDLGPFIKRCKAKYTCDTEDYSPCLCQGLQNSDLNYIRCIEELVPTVLNVFNRTSTIELSEVSFYKNSADDFIPDHLISNKKTGKIFFDCVYPTQAVRVSKKAFDSTRQPTTYAELSNCLLQDSDLSFIEGFTQMSYLSISNFYEMGKTFQTFPTNLQFISNLKFIQCSGWDTLANAPPPITGANRFVRLDITKSVNMNDDAMSMVMEWAVASFNSTLKSLYTNSNNLTRIPPQIEFFGGMDTLDIRNNFFTLIPSGSLKFNSNVMSLIDISNCGIEVIEPDAFVGNFDSIFIDLSRNNLTRLESSVFEDILLKNGIIDVLGSPFDCNHYPCHLAWIFNQNLQSSVMNAKCSNGTSFINLDPDFFAGC